MGLSRGEREAASMSEWTSDRVRQQLRCGNLALEGRISCTGMMACRRDTRIERGPRFLA